MQSNNEAYFLSVVRPAFEKTNYPVANPDAAKQP